MKLLVSACLLGDPVRYDGQAQRLADPSLRVWQQAGMLVPFCPEVAGGLPTPRPAAECQADGRILTGSGEDVTAAFRRGAEAALALCRREGIECALLKERSPSCGSQRIYDGRFRGVTLSGEGITATLLRQQGIRVFSEEQLDELKAFVASATDPLSSGSS